MQRTIWSVLLGLLLLPFTTHANDELLQLQRDPGRWVMQRKNYAATGYSELSQITAENVKHLKAAWTFSTGVLRGHEGAPLVVGTTMYVHSPFPNTIYALDLTKQPYAVKWSYTPQQNARAVPVACCDTVHRGVNYVEGKIILPTLDGQVIALNANTGKELWKVKNADTSKGETITGAGLVIKDNYIASVSDGEFGARCHVVDQRGDSTSNHADNVRLGTVRRSNLAGPRLRALHL
jgi:lanthanide-dependent methanol dehydrogenase